VDPATRNGTPLQAAPSPPPARPASQQPALERPHPALLLPVLNDLRARSGQEYQDFFQRLVADIRARGVQVPIIAYREAAKLRVIDGETRRQAALLAGAESIPVLVYEHKPEDKAILLAQLLANSMRLDMNPLEYAATYQQLMQLNNWTQAELAKQVQVSAGQVARVLAISTRLSAEVQTMVAAGDLSPRAAYALTRLPEQQQLELAKKAVTLPMAVESIEDAVGKLRGNGRKAKAKPLKLKLDGVQIVATNPTIEGLQAFFERGLAALRRLAKDGDDIAFLPARLKAV
jgi:ParB/RepB/Spo0J family partition protein